MKVGSDFLTVRLQGQVTWPEAERGAFAEPGGPYFYSLTSSSLSVITRT